MTREGRVSTVPLLRKLQRLDLAGLLLGTELPAPSYGTYDLWKGAEALKRALSPVVPCNSTYRSGVPKEPHVKTLGFPPTELTLLGLHRFLAEEFPGVPCARWQQWRLDTPVSPMLNGHTGCSMSLRFLQHYVDVQRART
jgi:hypothetical protein